MAKKKIKDYMTKICSSCSKTPCNCSMKEENEPTHIVTFQKGDVVGARRRRAVYVNAKNESDAVQKAKKEFPEHKKEGFKLNHVQTMSEENMSEEHDYEYEMARNQLATSSRSIERLMGMLKGEGNLEAWVQSKLTLAADYLDTVADYMESDKKTK